MKTLTVKLTRPAQKGGGDRYEATIEGEQKPWVVYFPQSISRAENGSPADSLTITIE